MDTDSFTVYIKMIFITDVFIKTLQKMLKLDLILQIMNYIDHSLKEQKGNWINKRSITWKNHDKTCWIKSKTYSYLIDDSSEDKAKGTKKCVTKRKLKFENYKSCLEATQRDNKLSRKKKEINIDSFFCYKRKHKEFTRNKTNKLEVKSITLLLKKLISLL